MRVAFVTSGIGRGRDDDQEAAELVSADVCVWNDPAVDWEDYDRVVIRSAWDYTFHVDAFLTWCHRIGPEHLSNRPDLVAFNAHKRYLQALEVPVVPTMFAPPGGPMPKLRGEVVVKPNISAGARDTGRFSAEEHPGALALIAQIHAGGRIALVQPYLPLIDPRGETAIVYLGGRRSHVLRKRPVLRESGVAPLAEGPAAPAAAMLESDLVSAGEATAVELRLAAAVHDEVSLRFGTPLYARIDLVPGPSGEPVLLELEVIEPCLYFSHAPGAAQRFAEAIRAS